MPLKSYAWRTAGITLALKAVIALLKLVDHCGVVARYSKSGMPTTFSTAGCPVCTECRASA